MFHRVCVYDTALSLVLRLAFSHVRSPFIGFDIPLSMYSQRLFFFNAIPCCKVFIGQHQSCDFPSQCLGTLFFGYFFFYSVHFPVHVERVALLPFGFLTGGLSA